MFVSLQSNEARLELAPAIHEKFEASLARPARADGPSWTCEFCGKRNDCDLVKEEIEQITAGAAIDYLVEQPYLFLVFL